ncbi:MAG: hypothetical protein AAFV88_17620 [Planctomycetota bacterium]
MLAIMAKPLVFLWGDQELSFALEKVDRSKLYGYKETEVLDESGGRCELATLADDGCTVVGRGGTGLGYVNADGLWCDKSELTPVDIDGQPIEPVASSFNAPIKLFDNVTAEQYLSHNIRLVYHLAIDELDADLDAELRRGTIFTFPYSYRGGLEADAGFLLLGQDDQLFLAVGNPTQAEMIGMQQPTSVDEDDVADEMDLMDFDMI